MGYFTDYGADINVKRYVANDRLKEVVEKRFLTLIDNSWQIDNEFKKYVHENGFSVTKKEERRICINFSFERTETETETTDYFEGYKGTAENGVVRLTPQYSTETKTTSYTTTDYASVYDRIYPDGIGENMMFEKTFLKFNDDTLELLNNYDAIINFIKSQKEQLKAKFISVSGIRNIKITSFDVTYYSVFEISVNYKGKEYSVCDIVPLNASNFNLDFNDDSVPLSKKALRTRKFLTTSTKLFKVLDIIFYIACILGAIGVGFLTITRASFEKYLYCAFVEFLLVLVPLIIQIKLKNVISFDLINGRKSSSLLFKALFFIDLKLVTDLVFSLIYIILFLNIFIKF